MKGTTATAASSSRRAGTHNNDAYSRVDTRGESAPTAPRRCLVAGGRWHLAALLQMQMCSCWVTSYRARWAHDLDARSGGGARCTQRTAPVRLLQ